MKMKTRVVSAMLAMLAALSATADGEPTQIDLSALNASKAIAGIYSVGDPSAYSSREAIYAFNGAGINGQKHTTTADNAMFMLSAYNSGTFPWYIQVDLGEVRRIDAVRL